MASQVGRTDSLVETIGHVVVVDSTDPVAHKGQLGAGSRTRPVDTVLDFAYDP